MVVIWRISLFPPQQLSVFWAYVFKCIICCLYYGVCVTYALLPTILFQHVLMTADNIIVSKVQVPNTFFENNNTDEIIVFDDLAKMMLPSFKETPENIAKNNTFRNQ